MIRRAKVLYAAVVACSGSGGVRDVVPVGQDIVVASREQRASATDDYEYVARRLHAVVGLAEARGIDAMAARRLVDHLADSLEGCIAGADSSGATPAIARGLPGAARVIATVDGSGAVAAANVRFDRGAGAAETALVCLVAPLRVFAFAPVVGSGRGLAIEAVWGEDVGQPAPTPPDAGQPALAPPDAGQPALTPPDAGAVTPAN